MQSNKALSSFNVEKCNNQVLHGVTHPVSSHATSFSHHFLSLLALYPFARFALSLSGLPSFVKSPEDQTGISGGVASFVCQATGEPKPRITWMKKGKKVSPPRFEVGTPPPPPRNAVEMAETHTNTNLHNHARRDETLTGVGFSLPLTFTH